MKILRQIIVLIGVVAALTACNTVSGIGKDIKKAGEAIDNAAK